MIFLFIGAANAATPTSMMLQDVQLPFNPTSDRIIGYVDILDDMHFEMDFVIHSWPSGTWPWASIFKCGPGEDNRQRYPGLWLHRDREGLLVQVRDEDAVVGGMRADSLALDTAYHVEVDFTQNWFTMVLNGETLYDDAKDFEHTLRHHVPCWASALWKDVADVTITNLVMSSKSTLFPTSSPTSPAPTSMMLQDVQLPFNPSADSIIGYVDVLDNMHFEMDFTIQSWPSGTWASIFKCGAGDINHQRYPGLWLHQNSGVIGAGNEGLYVRVRDDIVTTTKVGSSLGEALHLDTAYHVEVDFTQSWFTVVLNGQTVYDGAKGVHTLRHRVPCWASTLGHNVADVTITNLAMWSTSSMYPTKAPTPGPTAAPSSAPTAANECVAYPRYKAYWSYGDCGETYVAPNDFEACCEAAMAQREISGRDVDRFSFVMSSGRCYFKCGGGGAEGEGYRDYPGFTQDDDGDWRSSQENALPGCGCSPNAESHYEETAGFCRGGENWPGLSTAWNCISGSAMSVEECQSECDGSADCGAFDLPATDPPSGGCCLFTEGHTGNGQSGRVCFVETVDVNAAASIHQHGFTEATASDDGAGTFIPMILGAAIGTVAVAGVVALVVAKRKSAAKQTEAEMKDAVHVPDMSVSTATSKPVEAGPAAELSVSTVPENASSAGNAVDGVHVPEMSVSTVPATTGPAEAGHVVEMSVSTV